MGNKPDENVRMMGLALRLHREKSKHPAPAPEPVAPIGTVAWFQVRGWA